jgi:hypothetical protein
MSHNITVKPSAFYNLTKTSAATTFSALRSATSASDVASGNSAGPMISAVHPSTYDELCRGLFIFDAWFDSRSSGNAIMTEVTLNLTKSSTSADAFPNSTHERIHFCQHTPDDISSIAAGDYDISKFGSLLTEASEYYLHSDSSKVLTANAAGRQYFKTSQARSVGVIYYFDYYNSTITHPGSTKKYYVNINGSLTVQKYVLSITYTYPDYAKFRYRHNGTTYKISTAYGSGAGTGDRLVMRKGKSYYYMPLVASTHADASKFRVRLGSETMSGLLVP